MSGTTMYAESALLSIERSPVEPLVLERLVGVSSSNPSLSVDWREKSDRLDDTLETLARISSALLTAAAEPIAVFEAVVDAAAHALGARWAAIVLSGAHDRLGIARVFVHAGQGVIERWELPPRILSSLADRTLAARGPVVAEHDESLEFGGDPCVLVTAPMPVHDQPAGILAVALPYGAGVVPSDVSILVTLANHAGVALHNATLLREKEHRAAELERRGAELEGTLRRLERAGRRQLLSEERDRIARELHDSVAQHLLSIGMDLEWCRRHESTSPLVLERVLAAQSLARSAMDEIREVIAPGSCARVDLARALRDVIEDVGAGARLQVALRLYGQTQPVPAATQHSLVQIAREALFNVVRHADAHHAWVTLRWRSEVVSLAVADDGTGDHRKLQHQLFVSRPQGDHVGLTGVAERMRGLGGAVWFERRRGGGVKLRVEVPIRTVGGTSRARM